MKFARYLQDTQTPEWKRAYIDYKGLKKCIGAIRQSQEEHAAHFSTVDSPPMKPQTRRSSVVSALDLSKNALGLTPGEGCSDWTSLSPPNVGNVILIQRPEKAFRHNSMTSQVSGWIPQRDSQVISRHNSYDFPVGNIFGADLKDDALPYHHRRQSIFQSNPKPSKARLRFSFLSARSVPRGDLDNSLNGLALSELFRLLTPQEQQFFAMLDAELQKVDHFYGMKETELQARTRRMSEQLEELANHKLLFHRTPRVRSWSQLPSLWTKGKPVEDCTNTSTETTVVEDGLRFRLPVISFLQRERETDPSPALKAPGVKHSNDPEDYTYAKRKLKKAVVEHYRELEALANYRILNITGFQKGLKKFVKVTQIPVQEPYMSERVEKSSFNSARSVRQMMQQMEKLYAQAFLRNDTKKAREYLKADVHRVTSHHFSAFRSGLYLGVALPLLVTALYNVTKPEVQVQVPDWQSILHVYGILILPLIFVILVSLNIYAWSHFRINYVFIFELDTRTYLNHHKYLELPCLLFATFSYAMWLSFSENSYINSSRDIIPLVWLGLVAFIMFNPFGLLFRETRYWFLKRVGKLFLSGTRRVEFTDFWLADQLCSFTYTVGSLVYIVCIYTARFNEGECGSDASIWPAQWALTSVPNIIRFLQCIKRYHDTRLSMHLMNAGKYAAGIISTLFFYIWRGSGNASGYFTVWCMLNVVYTLYACAWDFYMDWSLFSFGSSFPFLREELVYANFVYVYYVAIAASVILRFAWLLYIPQPDSGWDFRLRSWVVGFLEMFRRFVWNFFRLENEHLGNVDQYRIVREVPLPYASDGRIQDVDDESADGQANKYRVDNFRN